jgi:hypothetical protein
MPPSGSLDATVGTYAGMGPSGAPSEVFTDGRRIQEKSPPPPHATDISLKKLGLKQS